MTDRLLARVLGPVRFPGRDDELTEPAGAMPRRLLVALALAGPEGRSVAGLTDDLWPEEPPRNPRGAVQMLVSRIRATAAEGLLQSTAAGYRLVGADLWSAETAQDDGAEAALGLWTGEPGRDLDDDELGVALAARADRARGRLLSLRVAALLDGGRAAEAVPPLEELIRLRPLDGAPVASLMRALADVGRVDAALGAFAAHRERLADALGADPVRARPTEHRPAARAGAARRSGAGRGPIGHPRAAGSGGGPGPPARDRAGPPPHVDHRDPRSGQDPARARAATRLADRFERIVFTELVGAQAPIDVELVVGAAVAPDRCSGPAG